MAPMISRDARGCAIHSVRILHRRTFGRTLRRVIVASLLSFSAVSEARAQRALLPLDDIAYTYIDALQARGMLRDLPLLERPYSVGAVRAATAAARGRLRDGDRKSVV